MFGIEYYPIFAGITLLLALIPGNMAKARNRNFWWYYIGSIIVPLYTGHILMSLIMVGIVMLILVIKGHKKEIIEKKEEFKMRICPTCKEATPIANKICVHCGAI